MSVRERVIREFKYPAKTTVPVGVGPDWEDRSWHNDASACCWLNVPTKKHPRAVIVLWVQPDDKGEWELTDQGRFQLDWMPDGDEGWTDECKTIMTTDDIGAVLAAVEAQKAISAKEG